MKERLCRFCNHKLTTTFVDLGMSPLSNAFVSEEQANQLEIFYPLHAYVCGKCFLVQLEEFESPKNIFNDYVYFSSYSESWLKHAKDFVSMIVPKLGLTEHSSVIEIASNDGYLLQYFKPYNIPVLGIEPAENVSEKARERGINTITSFFNSETARRLESENIKADLIIGNNVLAHVPNLCDFVQSLKTILKPHGVITMEFPHLLRLIQNNQFDTIYHEHFSYFSLLTVKKIFQFFELEIFNVEEIPTHGGSLRIYAKHMEDQTKKIEESINLLLEKEIEFGLNHLETYFSFSEKVKETKRVLLDFLIKIKRESKTVVGYGAPAKGNTLLNYCGIRNDFIDYTVDKNLMKQGMFLPGTHVPIYAPEKIKETKPDYILILPWNIQEEVIEQISYAKEWGCKFILVIPTLTVI